LTRTVGSNPTSSAIYKINIVMPLGSSFTKAMSNP
jgi:hypothetical protein